MSKHVPNVLLFINITGIIRIWETDIVLLFQVPSDLLFYVFFVKIRIDFWLAEIVQNKATINWNTISILKSTYIASSVIRSWASQKHALFGFLFFMESESRQYL